MSNEILSKKIALIISSVINTQYWKKNELQIVLKEILLTKRKRASSQEEYLEALLRNVAYFIDYTNETKSFLAYCCSASEVPILNVFITHMTNIRGQVNTPENLAETMNVYRPFVYKGETILEQVSNAEVVYCNCKLVNDMMIDVIRTLLQPDNRNFVEELLIFASEEVVETTLHYCKVYTNLYLDDFLV